MAALVVSLSVLPVGATIFAAPAPAPAYACTGSDDVNTLCSNEQAFVGDLAAYGITPTRSSRDLANLGWKVCGMLFSGNSNDGVVNSLYQGGTLNREQSQVIVNIAQNRLC